MNAGLHATSPLGDADLVHVDQAHYMYGCHVFNDHRVNGPSNIAAGDGAYIYDTICNRYLDMAGDMWCTSVGPGREEMARTVAEQTRLLTYPDPFYDMANPHVIEFCRKLTKLTPGNFDHMSLVISGSATVGAAIRLMYYYQNYRSKRAKKHVTTRINVYHGSAFLDMSLGSKSVGRPAKFNFLDECVHHLAYPYCCHTPEGVGEAEFFDGLVEKFERKILRLGTDRVGVLTPKPVFGSGGAIVPLVGYHRRMWGLYQRYDMLYISGEVMTSFGRLGHFFASQAVFGIQSGIILVAKGLISGYQPLGARIFSRCIWEVIVEPGKGRCFSHGFIYSGHPVAYAAALKNIEIIEREGLFTHTDEVGRYFEEHLQSLCNLPIIDDVRGIHLMTCVEFVADKTSRVLFPESLNIGEWVHLWAQKRGLLVRPVVHLNVMSPLLIPTREQVDAMVRVLRESIEETAGGLVRADHR